MVQEALDPQEFRRIMSHYPTGVCVITARGHDGPVGMVVGSFTSVSLDPMLVAFLPDRRSTTWPRIEAAGHFCVNVLAHGQQGSVCRRFASKGEDKFAGVPNRLSSWGRPRSSKASWRGWIANFTRCMKPVTISSFAGVCAGWGSTTGIRRLFSRAARTATVAVGEMGGSEPQSQPGQEAAA